MSCKRFGIFAAAAISAAALAACSSLGLGSSSATYEARLYPLNVELTGTEANGSATMQVQGDKLLISIDMAGVPPNMVHWQHFHGMEAGSAASCARQSDDANGDGILDLMETARASGTTMVPFDDAPAEMDVAHGTYPSAAADGTYHYRQEVSLKKLKKAFAKAFDGQELALEQRVIYVHGVPASTPLPASVATLDPVPAHVTLPIACGQFTKR